jgi:hypothetical protein
MTCIVASKIGKDGLIIGADNIGSRIDGFVMTRNDRKIFEKKTSNGTSLTFAFAESFRAIQILETFLVPPDDTNLEPLQYIKGALIPEIISTLENNNYNVLEANMDGLLIYKGEIYYIGDDFQVDICDDYYAIGIGNQLAIGSLYTSKKLGATSNESVNLALEVAEKHNGFVRRPWDIRRIDANK